MYAHPRSLKREGMSHLSSSFYFQHLQDRCLLNYDNELGKDKKDYKNPDFRINM